MPTPYDERREPHADPAVLTWSAFKQIIESMGVKPDDRIASIRLASPSPVVNVQIDDCEGGRMFTVTGRVDDPFGVGPVDSVTVAPAPPVF